MVLSHLLQDLDKETNLDLGGLLEQRVQSSGALGLAQDAEPLLDGAQFVLEILVERGGGHLLEGGLVLVDVGDPLLGELVLGVHVGVAVALARLHLAVEVRRRADAARGSLASEGRHVGGRTEVVVVAAHGTRRGRPQRGEVGGLGRAVAVAHEVGHVEHVGRGGPRIGVEGSSGSRQEVYKRRWERIKASFLKIGRHPVRCQGKLKQGSRLFHCQWMLATASQVSSFCRTGFHATEGHVRSAYVPGVGYRMRSQRWIIRRIRCFRCRGTFEVAADGGEGTKRRAKIFEDSCSNPLASKEDRKSRGRRSRKGTRFCQRQRLTLARVPSRSVLC